MKEFSSHLNVPQNQTNVDIAKKETLKKKWSYGTNVMCVYDA